VARLRLWGHYKLDEQPTPIRRPAYIPIKTGSRCTVIAHNDENEVPSQQSVIQPEVSAEALGGKAIACSNKHYGTPQNLLQASLGKDMGDGWETARHPERPASWKRNTASGLVESDLMDWCILQLAQVAEDGIDHIVGYQAFSWQLPRIRTSRRVLPRRQCHSGRGAASRMVSFDFPLPHGG